MEILFYYDVNSKASQMYLYSAFHSCFKAALQKKSMLIIFQLWNVFEAPHSKCFQGAAVYEFGIILNVLH